MFRNWKKILFVFIVVGLVYGACNTAGILATEEFFRVKNPDLALTPKVCYMLGANAFRSFRYQLSIEITDRNLKDFPYENAAVDAQYRRAAAYEKLGQYDKAIALYEEFLMGHADDNRYKTVMGKIQKLKMLHQE